MVYLYCIRRWSKFLYRTLTEVLVINNQPKPTIKCNDNRPVYEGSDDFELDCSVENETPDDTYSWTGTDISDRLSATDVLDVPCLMCLDNVNGDTEYDYEITFTSPSFRDTTHNVKVTVLENDITVSCDGPYTKTEGDANFDFSCTAVGAPSYDWSVDTSDRLTVDLTATDATIPIEFDVPDDIDSDTTYTYTFTASATDRDSGSDEISITVNDVPAADPILSCSDVEVSDKDIDFTVNCTVDNEPSDASYSWTGRNVNLLSSTDILQPTFNVRDIIDSRVYSVTYDYEVTLSSSTLSNDITEGWKITIINYTIDWCFDGVTHRVREGEDPELLQTCSDGNDPTLSPPDTTTQKEFTYSWSTTGSTPSDAISMLSATDIKIHLILTFLLMWMLI